MFYKAVFLPVLSSKGCDIHFGLRLVINQRPVYHYLITCIFQVTHHCLECPLH